MEYPKMFRVKQELEGPMLADVPRAVRDTIRGLGLQGKVKAGQTVAILGATGKKTHWDNMENTRHGDFVDQASDDNEVHVNIKLRQTDAKLLRAIEAAIGRVDNGTYGICAECEQEISQARLQAVPWTSVCLACKEKKKTA